MVAKVSDALAHLSVVEQKQLADLLLKVERGRLSSGKQLLQGLFIECDWPEYEAAKNSIMERSGK